MMTLGMERKKERNKERQKDRHLRQCKNENELPQVGFEPTTLCTPDRCSYPCTCKNSIEVNFSA